MESGSLLGGLMILALMLTSAGVTLVFARRPASGRSLLVYVAVLLSALALLAGINYLLAFGLNVSDSSHGVMAVGLPFVAALLLFAFCSAGMVLRWALTLYSTRTRARAARAG